MPISLELTFRELYGRTLGARCGRHVVRAAFGRKTERYLPCSLRSVPNGPIVFAMGRNDPANLTESAFAQLPDECMPRRIIHRIDEVVMIALCSILSDNDAFTDMEDLCQVAARLAAHDPERLVRRASAAGLFSAQRRATNSRRSPACSRRSP